MRFTSGRITVSSTMIDSMPRMASSAPRMMSSLVKEKICAISDGSGSSGDRRRLGEAQVDDLDLVAAVAVEADRRAHQSGDALQFVLGARLVGELSVRAVW